jgi:hypothetical protein
MHAERNSTEGKSLICSCMLVPRTQKSVVWFLFAQNLHTTMSLYIIHFLFNLTENCCTDKIKNSKYAEMQRLDSLHVTS